MASVTNLEFMRGRVSINIVTWNSAKYLPDVLQSIFNQTCKDFSVIVIDNGSTDETVNLIQKKYPHITMLRNFKNRGFAVAHNQGIKLALNKWQIVQAAKDRGLENYYILVTNPDVILAPNFLETIVNVMDKNVYTGSAGGKLLRASGQDDDQGLSPFYAAEWRPRTQIIDSTGLEILKSRQVVDRGAGEDDAGQYNNTEEVFGVSGALALYRLKALEGIKILKKRRRCINSDGRIRNRNSADSADESACEYFDENFFAYKEDVDLAWRLRLRGWKALYVPEAKAYHYRTVFGSVQRSWREAIRDQRKKSEAVKFYSCKNHYLISVKNDFVFNYLLHLPFIFTYELKKFLYTLLFEPVLFLSRFRVCIELSDAIWKRKMIMRKRKATAREIRKWFR